MADRDRERVGGVLVRDLGAEDELYHPLHLRLLGASVPAHHLLHVRRRVLSCCDAGDGAGDEDGTPGLPDRERDAGVCADERLLQGDCIRPVLGDEPCDPVEDRLEAEILALAGARDPAPVCSGPEAPVAFLDDAVPARCRPWIDAEDFHADTLGTVPDDSFVPPPLRFPLGARVFGLRIGGAPSEHCSDQGLRPVRRSRTADEES